MQDILNDVKAWREAGESVALATVVRCSGSTPRPLGSAMAITHSGRIAGSVSAGCLEAAVVQAAHDVLDTGVPKLIHYGITEDMAWEVGLSCGGEVDVFVEPLNW